MMRKIINPSGTLILPHWQIEGGAGFYIRDFIKKILFYDRVMVAGIYAADYSNQPIISDFYNKLGSLNFPAYRGVKPLATIFHTIISFFKIIQIFLSYKSKDGRILQPKIIIFTSSIQAISIPIVRYFLPKTRIVTIIQEQVNLSMGFGLLTAAFLKKSDVVIAITSEWAKHACDIGIEAKIYRNNYDPSFADNKYNNEVAIISDILYVGGGSKIKGFDEFIAALPQLLNLSIHKIICLGTYSKAQIIKLNEIAKKMLGKEKLLIVGHVPDIRPYLRGTSLLILPIGSPHFCRPAIEAGLFGKSFIISDFLELSEFAKNGENCLSYKSGDSSDLVYKIQYLLENQELRKKLEIGNLNLAQAFTHEQDLSMIYNDE